MNGFTISLLTHLTEYTPPADLSLYTGFIRLTSMDRLDRCQAVPQMTGKPTKQE